MVKTRGAIIEGHKQKCKYKGLSQQFGIVEKQLQDSKLLQTYLTKKKTGRILCISSLVDQIILRTSHYYPWLEAPDIA